MEELKVTRNRILSSIPISYSKDLESETKEAELVWDGEEENFSNANFAIRHVIMELEERNRKYQFLAASSKGGVPIIDIRGILNHMKVKKNVTQHTIYKKFIELVKEHYSSVNESVEVDDLLVKVRALITENGTIIKEMFCKDDKSEGEIFNLELDELTPDPPLTGRNFFDIFAEHNVLDLQLPGEDNDLSEPQLQRNSASSPCLDHGSSPDSTPEPFIEQEFPLSFPRRKRGRPRKEEQESSNFILTQEEISINSGEKRKRGRPKKIRKPDLLIPENFKSSPLATITEESQEKRKRGRPKKLKLLEDNPTKETLINLTSTAVITENTSPFVSSFINSKRKRGRPKKITFDESTNLIDGLRSDEDLFSEKINNENQDSNIENTTPEDFNTDSFLFDANNLLFESSSNGNTKPETIDNLFTEFYLMEQNKQITSEKLDENNFPTTDGRYTVRPMKTLNTSDNVESDSPMSASQPSSPESESTRKSREIQNKNLKLEDLFEEEWIEEQEDDVDIKEERISVITSRWTKENLSEYIPNNISTRQKNNESNSPSILAEEACKKCVQ